MKVFVTEYLAIKKNTKFASEHKKETRHCIKKAFFSKDKKRIILWPKPSRVGRSWPHSGPYLLANLAATFLGTYDASIYDYTASNLHI